QSKRTSGSEADPSNKSAGYHRLAPCLSLSAASGAQYVTFPVQNETKPAAVQLPPSALGGEDGITALSCVSRFGRGIYLHLRIRYYGRPKGDQAPAHQVASSRHQLRSKPLSRIGTQSSGISRNNSRSRW